MKNVLFALLIFGGVVSSAAAKSGSYDVSDDRLIEMLDGLTRDGIETRICRGESCFYLVNGYVWFTEDNWDAFADKQHLFSDFDVEFVDDYDDEPFLDDESYLDIKRLPRLRNQKLGSGGMGNRSGNRSGNNNGSGNTFNLYIGGRGNGSNGNSRRNEGDRSCRSCHTKVHPRFGKVSD